MVNYLAEIEFAASVHGIALLLLLRQSTGAVPQAWTGASAKTITWQH